MGPDRQRQFGAEPAVSVRNREPVREPGPVPGPGVSPKRDPEAAPAGGPDGLLAWSPATRCKRRSKTKQVERSVGGMIELHV